MSKWRVLVLGGYGNFGQIIVRHLQKMTGINLIIAGRRLSKAQQLAAEVNAEALQLDANQVDLSIVLKQQQVNLLISTAGPCRTIKWPVQPLRLALTILI